MRPAVDPADRNDPRTGLEAGRSGLWMGILAFRFASCIWMVFLVSTTRGYERPYLAWGLVAVAVSWTLFLTITRSWWKHPALWLDLVISFSFVLLSGAALEHGGIVSTHPFFTAAYPASTALMWGAEFGTFAGAGCALSLCFALALARPMNGIPLSTLNGNQLQAFLSGCVYYLAAGVAAGLVALLVDRSGDVLREANAVAMQERERAARLAERESMARAIHDHVLQALALVHKRGKELSQQGMVSGEAVGELAEMAGKQEEVLRGLILREPEEPPVGMASLRDAVEKEAARLDRIHPVVSATGPIWLPAAQVDALSLAVRQALENVARHAAASRISLYAEEEDGVVAIAIRDDGIGFEYDEATLRSQGKLGILGSMKGRIEELGGSLEVRSSPGNGTEVEFRVPAEAGVG
jgi:signal transduction histidine kinase